MRIGWGLLCRVLDRRDIFLGDFRWFSMGWLDRVVFVMLDVVA